MDFESEQIREVFAHYGLAMYQASCLERQIALRLSRRHDPLTGHISRWRYEDLLTKHFAKTLGKLVEGLEETGPLPPTVKEALKEALERRNWLVHHYWWERAGEFITPEGRERMIAELSTWADDFAGLDSYFTDEHMAWMRKVGIRCDEDFINAYVQDVSSGATAWSPWLPRSRALRKREEVVACYRWHPRDHPEQGPQPLLQADDGAFFMFCESGLMRGAAQVDVADLERITDFDKALPTSISTRIAAAEPWRWEVQLAHGYFLWARPDQHEGKPVFRWGITKDLTRLEARLRKLHEKE